MTEKPGVIVIIEDDFTSRGELSEKLENEGWKVSLVSRGEGMLDSIAAAAPDIIITDIDRDDLLDPYKTLSSLKGDERLSGAEIFVYTDQVDVQTEVAIKRLKIFSCFEKSKDPAYLVDAVTGYFEQKEREEQEDGFESEVGEMDLAEKGFDVSEEDFAPADGRGVDFTEILGEFQQGVEKSMESAGEGGAGTRYELGLSYLEMGLLEQALAEFEKLRDIPHLAEKSAHMTGVTLRKMGRYDKAVEAFKKGHEIAADDFSRLSFRYELADSLEMGGRPREAFKVFASIYKADKGFKDVKSRLLALKSSMEIKNSI
ncbi:MAG: tetratricopeptide repeat protein [Candidatus Nitrospinota bacterium M3_3B_026]